MTQKEVLQEVEKYILETRCYIHQKLNTNIRKIYAQHLEEYILRQK